jgi:mannosyltransferase
VRDRTLPILAGVTALAAALRFATLDAQSYWNDEAVTVLLLDQGLGGLLGDIPDSESTPPLYYVLAWLWSQVFGTGEVGLRSLSALVGTATVPAAYVAGAQLVSRQAGLVAAALVAANPLLVWYSQEVRAYALLVLLAALSLWLFGRALDGDRRALAGWALVAALGLATHYFALFVILPEAIWLLARLRPRRPAALAVALPAVTGLALLPLALHQRSNQGADFIEDSSLGFRLAQVPKQFLVGFDAPAEVLLVALAGACVVVGIALAPRDVQVPLAIGGAAVLIPVGLAVVGVDYVITRNLIAAVPPLAIAVGAGFAARRAGIAAAAILCAVGAATAIWVAEEPEAQRDDWRSAAEALGPAAVDRALVVTPVDGRKPLQIYLPDARLARSDEPLTVREVALLGLAGRRPGAEPDRPDEPFPGAPGTPGFTPAERLDEPTFTLIRYRAAQPVTVQPPAIATFRLDRDGNQLVLYEPASP